MEEHIEAALMKAGARFEKKDQRIKKLEQERDELKAHLAIFIDMAKSHKQSFIDDGYLHEAIQIQELIDSIPKQSLAEIQGKAAIDYENSLSSIHWTAKEYADDLIKQARKV